MSNNRKSVIYTREDYLRIHQLVLDYQAKKPGSAKLLIAAFDRFLWKYVNCIAHGVFDVNDPSLRKFVCMFITDPVIKKQSYQYKKPYIRVHIEEVAVNTVVSFFENYSETEIKHELICSFLSMAKRYKDYDKPSFHNYILRCFHFEAFRTLSSLVNDPNIKSIDDPLIQNAYIDHNVEKEIIEIEEHLNEWSNIVNSDFPITTAYSKPKLETSLDINWINGVTCSDTFDTLTLFERDILIKFYVEHLSDSDIGSVYGLCRATINRKKQEAKDKLEQRMLEVRQKEKLNIKDELN